MITTIYAPSATDTLILAVAAAIARRPGVDPVAVDLMRTGLRPGGDPEQAALTLAWLGPRDDDGTAERSRELWGAAESLTSAAWARRAGVDPRPALRAALRHLRMARGAER